MRFNELKIRMPSHVKKKVELTSHDNRHLCSVTSETISSKPPIQSYSPPGPKGSGTPKAPDVPEPVDDEVLLSFEEWKRGRQPCRQTSRCNRSSLGANANSDNGSDPMSSLHDASPSSGPCSGTTRGSFPAF